MAGHLDVGMVGLVMVDGPEGDEFQAAVPVTEDQLFALAFKGGPGILPVDVQALHVGAGAQGGKHVGAPGHGGQGGPVRGADQPDGRVERLRDGGS